MKEPFSFKKFFQYFLQGLIILAPIVITIWAVTSLFNFVDRILPDLLIRFFPTTKDVYFTGLGFLVVILIVFFVGYISSSFVVSRLVLLFDNILEKTPGIKILYSTVKDFFEAFAGNKRKFDKAVLVNVESAEVWRVGFITRQDLTEFGLHDFVAVYLPQSYALAGHVYLVKRERVRVLTNISSAEAMKFVVSGGVADLNEDHHKG
jgi:uncharacterized membrane protein